MQQTINSYNLYRIPNTNPAIATAAVNGGSVQFIVGAGVYQIDGSNLQVDYTSILAGATGSKIYVRSDCFVAGQAPTVVTIDGIQRAQYLNLTAAQLAYAQDLIDFSGDKQDTANAQAYVSTKKLFECLGPSGVAANTAAGLNYSKAFQLKHFFPGMWNEGDKYFVVNSIMNITMNLGLLSATATGVEISIAQQTTDTNSALTTAAAGSGATTFNFYLNLKRITNQVEAAAQSISPHITCFLQQVQPLAGTGSSTFNQSFGSNQVSPWQQMVIFPTVSTTYGTQFNLDEVTDSASAVNIQRCGVNIVAAISTYEAKAQLQLLKSVNKKNYNNFVITFDTVFSNTNVQTIINATALANTTAILGYSYITQMM